MRHDKLLIISNRLPLSVEHRNGKITVTRSSGGLVTALEPILKQHGGVWIGSAGTNDDPKVAKKLQDAATSDGFQCVPVFLTEEEQSGFYEGFSNQVLWPLFHDLVGECNFEPSFWESYRRVNARFANAATRAASNGELIWIHDYQLMQVAASLREKGSKARVAFFLHTPFPSLDILAKLPWRRELLEGLLAHDLIGVQTVRDLRNMVSCLRHLVPGITINSGANSRSVATGSGRVTTIRHFPISIDYAEFAHSASAPEVEHRMQQIRHELNTRRMIIGIDRQDYTKGIPHRFRAFAALLERQPSLRSHVTFVQIVVPSRQNIPGYEALKSRIEHLVGSINGEYTQPGWVPINYIHRSVPHTELLALYRAADVALVTPLKDGMNLVAKEFCATRLDNHGVLILSEFAGAAAEMATGAILVNPYDMVGVADAIDQALHMPQHEQRQRMLRLRRGIRQSNIHRWVDDFLGALESEVPALAA